MIEAVMLWNEPNNKSHWDPQIDPGWNRFAAMAIAAARAIAAERPQLPRALGGISPIDPAFIRNMAGQGVLDHVDVVAVHGFPLDWNLWRIDEWPDKLAEIRAVTDLPIWVSEVGVSSFGAEEVQAWGLDRTAELLIGRAPRIHWYSLYDLPRTWEATTRHKEAEGSSYYRHFTWGCCAKMGRPSGRPPGFPDTHLTSASASGFISRTTASTMLLTGCADWGSGISAPDSHGPTAFGPARSIGSTGRWLRSPSST
jgi:beta-xylosidase